jgi:hypothetical protein
MDRKCHQRHIYYNDRYKKKNNNDWLWPIKTSQVLRNMFINFWGSLSQLQNVGAVH